MEAEKKKLREKLEKFPSLIRTINDISSVHKDYLEIRLNDFQRELKESITQMDKCRINNLISFMYFLLGKTDEALMKNDDSLKICPDNVIGLSNRGWFLLKTEQKFIEINKTCQRLDEMKDDKTKMAIAKGEIAFAYSRLGITFYSTAIKLYSEAIRDAEAIENPPNPHEMKENICIWSYEWALAQTRLFRFYNVCNKSDLEQSKEKVVSVCKLLKHVIESNLESTACRKLIPRAYVLLGEIANSIESKGNIHVGLIQEVLQEKPELTVDGYYEKALQLQNDDTFVLDRCGMRLKLIHQLDEAIKIFEKSIKIQDTSLNHHHLAVALKEKLQVGLGYGNVHSVSRKLFEKMEGDNSNSHHQSHNSRNKVPAATNLEARKKRLINSPNKVDKLDLSEHEDTINEILMHLDKAIEIGMNTDAVFDKGLLLRQTGQLKEAIQVFRILTNNKLTPTSLVVLAASYEQIGYCLLEFIDRNESQDKDSDKEDMKMNFKKSLEISCEIVAKIPHLKNCWDTAPTFQLLLERNATTKDALQDLEFLYDKMEEYGKYIDTVKQLLSSAETNEEQMEYSLKIIQKHLEKKRFDDAVLSFEFIMCLPAWQELVDTELFVKVYIEGAFDSYRRGDEDIARLRFNDAFDFCHSKLRQSDTTKLDTMKFNVLVLCNPNDESIGNKLLALLKHLGIKATLNTEGSYQFGRLDSECLTEMLEQSNHVLVVYDFIQSGPVNDKELIRNVDIMYKIHSIRGHGNVRTIVPDETIRSNVPTTLPSQIDTFDFSFADDELGSKVESVKDILIRLAIGDNK